MSRGRDEKLFRAAVAYLDDSEWLSSVLIEEMYIVPAWHMAGRQFIQIERIATSRLKRPEDKIIGAIIAGQPALASMGSPLDHFSVICDDRPKRWLLLDSYGING